MALDKLCDSGVTGMTDGASWKSIACMAYWEKCLHISEPLDDHIYNSEGHISQFHLPFLSGRWLALKDLASQKGEFCLRFT